MFLALKHVLDLTTRLFSAWSSSLPFRFIISELMRQDSRRKRAAKRVSATNVTGLLLTLSFVVIFT